jgi:hypothetical protein
MIGGLQMITNQTDFIALLKQGDKKDVFIELTIAINSSPYIEDEVKLKIMKRLADAYQHLNETLIH